MRRFKSLPNIKHHLRNPGLVLDLFIFWGRDGWELCKMTEPRGQEAPEYFLKTGYFSIRFNAVYNRGGDACSIWTWSFKGSTAGPNVYLGDINQLPTAGPNYQPLSGPRFTPNKELLIWIQVHPKKGIMVSSFNPSQRSKSSRPIIPRTFPSMDPNKVHINNQLFMAETQV